MSCARQKVSVSAALIPSVPPTQALAHAGAYAFAHRRDKKGDMRRLWNVKINAGLRLLDPKNSYSKFIGAAKKKNIAIDRKILAHLAEFKPETFKKVVDMIG